MSVEDNKLLVSKFIEETLNKGNVDAAEEYVADSVVELVPFPGQGPGLAGLKDVLRGMRKAFPDMHWTIKEQIAEADKVLTRFTWTGTHKAEFLGVHATGRQFEPVRDFISGAIVMVLEPRSVSYTTPRRVTTKVMTPDSR